MASEIRVNNIKALTGLGTVTISSDGINVGAGIITANNFKGGVELTSGSLTGISTIGVTTITATNLTVNGNAYPSAGPLSNRNLIINGDMRVSQRSTSVSVSDGSNEGYQSLDRFAFYFSSSASGEATISQSTTVPSGEGFSNSYKVDVTTANTLSGTQTLLIRHRIEAQDLANSGWNYTSTSSNISISFWARSTKAGTYCLRLKLEDTSTDEYYIAEYTLSADTWKRVEITVPGQSNAVINNDNGTGLELEWILGSNDTSGTAGSWFDSSARATTNQVNVFDSTDGEFYLTGVQLEVGSVVTPFEHRSYGDELARCQRYYYRVTSNNDHTIAVGYNQNTSVTRHMTFFPVTMRVQPSALEQSGTASDYSIYHGTSLTVCTSVPVFTNCTTHCAEVQATASSSLTAGQGSLLSMESTGYLAWSAEL